MFRGRRGLQILCGGGEVALRRVGFATIEPDGSLFGLATDTGMEKVWVDISAQLLVIQVFDSRRTALTHEELMWRIAEAAVHLDAPLAKHLRHDAVRLVSHQNVRSLIDAIS